ncbi:hypothetical protein CC79DRAFT_1332597 [Sarocladium strictum]
MAIGITSTFPLRYCLQFSAMPRRRRVAGEDPHVTASIRGPKTGSLRLTSPPHSTTQGTRRGWASVV